MTGQTSSQSYLLRLQGHLHPVCVDIAGPAGETDNALENAENGVVPVVTLNMSTTDRAASGEHMPVTLSSSQN